MITKSLNLAVMFLLVALLPLVRNNMTLQAAATTPQEKLQKLIDQAVLEGLVGVSVAVYTPKESMVLASAGVSDRKNNTRLTTSDIARIASCSKVWVGAAVMQLVQEGKIALSDKIAKYISPETAKNIANAGTATIEQVLSHTSGIFDYYNQSDFGTDVPDKMDFTIDEALHYAWGESANFNPGEKFGYSNSNTLLLALIIEKVTGKPLAAALRERIFTPLGLKHTFIEVFEKVPAKIVRGYAYDEKGKVAEIGDKDQGAGLPDGGVVTTPEDMALFMRALFGQNQLLDKATVKLMVTPVADAGDSSVGYHIFISNTANGVRYEHDGAIDGYLAEEMYYPESDVAVALWTNSSGPTQSDLFDTLQAQIVSLIFP